jgi:hypothetical protein
MDPTPGKNLIDARQSLAEGTKIIMEYNPRNWGSQRWYTNWIDELVSEVKKRGDVYNTESQTGDHMNIPSDMLIRYRKIIEPNL